MSKQTEALKLALNKAFQLGQRYWSWADSEYSSHWKKADAAKAKFDKLVQDTVNAELAEQPAQQQELEHDEHGHECSPEEFLLRGILASELKCWHRLTADEAQNLVAFVQNTPSKPASKPLSVEQIAELDCNDHYKFARAIEAAHGIKE